MLDCEQTILDDSEDCRRRPSRLATAGWSEPSFRAGVFIG